MQGILGTASAGFIQIPLASAGDDYGDYTTAWGDDASAVAAEDLSAVVWGGAAITAEPVVDEVGLASAGEDVGGITFTVGERSYTVELVLDATHRRPGPVVAPRAPVRAVLVRPQYSGRFGTTSSPDD